MADAPKDASFKTVQVEALVSFPTGCPTMVMALAVVKRRC